LRSASHFVDLGATELDAYCLPQLPDCYIANASLRNLQASAALKVAGATAAAAAAPAAAAQAAGGAPAVIPADIQALRSMPNLHTLAVGTPVEEPSQKVLTALMECIRHRCHHDAQVLSNNSVKKAMKLVISGASTRPEDILFVGRVPLVASETKRHQFSVLTCMPQALAAGADVARELRNRCGVDHPGVPVVLLAGDVVQFAGVFLIANDFPVFCLLSRPLNLLCQEDLLHLWAWVDAVAAHATATKAAASLVPSPAPPHNPLLNVDGHFFKPVRGSTPDPNLRATEHRATLITMMRVYKLLHDSTDAQPHVLFPLGVAQMTAADTEVGRDFNRGLVSAMRVDFRRWAHPLTPVLVYQQLEGEWTNNHPGRWSAAYCKAVHTAVAAVTAAGVAMLDLRPANVMWRSCADGTVEVRLIDFEFVLPEGYLIPDALIKAQKEDERYDVSQYDYDKRDNHYYASTKINHHWLRNIGGWAAQDDGHGHVASGASAFT
jgi:hypothetical protein